MEQPLRHMLLGALRRRHLSASQKAVLALQLEAVERERLQATERRRAGTRSQLRATLPEARRPRQLAAQLAGVSARTVQDALTVEQADPQLLAAVLRGELAVDKAARQVRRKRRYAEIASAPAPLPSGSFEIILADPPWQLGNPEGAFAPENHYPTLPLDEIEAIRPPAAEAGLLFLWAVNCLIPQAIGVLRAWGYGYRTNIVWQKPSIGLGFWARNKHELLLLGRRGNYPLPAPEHRPESVIAAPRGRHSEKPAAFYELIERMYPQASRLELFARKARFGWSSWGNEVGP